MILSTGYQTARRGLTSLRTGYISKPMPTTARPEPIIRRTPTVIEPRSVSPSTKASIKDVPTMAVTIWTTNRTPTMVAVVRREIRLRVLGIGAGGGAQAGHGVPFVGVGSGEPNGVRLMW